MLRLEEETPNEESWPTSETKKPSQEVLVLRVTCVMLFVWALLTSTALIVTRASRDSPTGLTCPLPHDSKSGTPRLTILHLNDVYELPSLGGYGGLARCVGMKKKLLAQNPYTIAVLAGDYLSPSAMSTAEVEGEKLQGRQMIDLANMFIDFMTFGNHEFDLKVDVLSRRIRESNFTWILSNGFLPGQHSNIVSYVVRVFAGFRVGIVGVVTDMNTPAYVTIQNYTTTVATLRGIVRALRMEHSVDVIVALTHWSIETDIMLAAEGLGLDLIVGGHEHENSYHRATHDLVPIAKADSNARTVYVHELYRDPTRAKKIVVESTLVPMDKDACQDDAAAADRAAEWWDMAKAAFAKQGFQVNDTAATIDVQWDATSAVLRTSSNTLTQTISASMLACSPKPVDGAFYNSGSLRMDDFLGPGRLTVYDILRLMPYDNRMLAVSLPGEVVQRVWDISFGKNRGTGGYLQWSQNFSQSSSSVLLLNGKTLLNDEWYTFLTTDYLVSGGERNLGFLKLPDDANNTITRKISDFGEPLDLRKCFIKYIAS